MTAAASNSLSDAEALRGLGFALCRLSTGTKNPTYTGWPTFSLEPGDFAPGDLIGIIGGPLSNGNKPGHALVIPDLDSLEALEKADAFLPPTAMMDTRDGKPAPDHRYYLVPVATIPTWAQSDCDQGAPAARQATGHPGPFKKQFRHAETNKGVIDFIGTGGQVACPGGGGKRQWVGGEPGEPAVVPFPELWGAVCKLAEACGCELPSTNGNGRHKPMPMRMKASSGTSVTDRAIAYLASCPAAVDGEGGSKITFYVARAVVYGFDLGPDVGFDLLRDHYNPRCQGPWSERELRHKCKDADRLPFNKPRGWLRDQERPEWRQADLEDARSNGAASQPADYHLTDTGNAKRVADRHGADLRFCHPWKQWQTWDGKRWAGDDTGEPARRVKETAAELYRSTTEAMEALAEADASVRKAQAASLAKVLKHCLVWEEAHKIAATLEVLRSEAGIPILPSQLDADPFLLNVLNGTLDLRTGTLRPHRREDYLTKICRVGYDPAATCPTWHRFLTRIIASRAVVDYLQRVVGYCLTGDTREQSLFFYGAGANGKSTFLTAIREVMGDYAIQAVSELLLAKSNESHPTERADLFGRRFVATIETDQGKAMAEALMKQLTGGDSIRARKMRQDFFEFMPTHKIILAANHKPAVRGTDHAVWRRIKLVPFTVTITDTEKDTTLPDKLRAEYPGILTWAVQGCRQWLKDGLGEPAEVRQATMAYQAEQDSVGQFLAEVCNLHRELRAKSSALLEAYICWSGDRCMTPRSFRDLLKAKGYESRRGHGGAYFWHGIGLPATPLGEG